MLSETWEHSCKNPESIESYIIRMYDQLSGMSDLVQDNLKKAHDKTKQWYDRNALERTFRKGDDVIVLSPKSSNRLLSPMEWILPYDQDHLF